MVGSENALHVSNQSIETLQSVEYWKLVAPLLTISDDDNATTRISAVVVIPGDTIIDAQELDASRDASRRSALSVRGFFHVGAAEIGISHTILNALYVSIPLLVALGHEPSAIYMYDEAWACGDALAALCMRASGNPPSGDAVAFLVAPQRHLFSGPHRDKPLAGTSSFRPDGAPMFVTAWLALSNTPPASSCLYFLPADRDPGYTAPGDAIREALTTPTAWPRIQAQPCAAGDVLVFSHRLLHWGGEAEAGAPPRAALSFSFSDPAFEPAAFDATYLPFPPLRLRLAHVAAQAILYAEQAPLDKGGLALANRTFAQQQKMFDQVYAERVLTAAQTLKFQMQQQRRR